MVVDRMTELPHLTMTRAAYDTVAADYAELLIDALANSPWDRALLGTFAQVVDRNKPVVDLGCGPGRISAHLHELGLQVSGIDLSPAMVEVARRTYPHLQFEEGRLAELNSASSSLGGIVAWYSIIHTPQGHLPAIFAEFHRVLVVGGHLLLAFQVGDERVRLTHSYGHDICLDAYRLSPERITNLLSEAGFRVQATVIREPEGVERTQQAYLLAQKQES